MGEHDPFSVSSPDGTTITARTAGEGPPLVLVHGTAGSALRWVPLLPRLGERFTCYAIDRRGRGASTDTAPYALEREVEDLAAVIDAAHDRHDAPVNVLGHSFGGLIALEAALGSRNLRRLVLYEPGVGIGTDDGADSELIRRLDATLREDGPEATLLLFLKEIVRMDEAQLDAFKASSLWEARVEAAGTIPRELRAEIEYVFEPARFERCRVRTEVMMGSESPPALTAAARTVRMALPRATLAVLDGQQHVAMDTAPDLFLATVFDFLG